MVAILNAAGNTLVEYTYDAWGKSLSTNSSVEDHPVAYNPLRYRGYVYDTETGLYYLQSRYYDPELGRFLNADALVSTGQGLLGNNMFAYCLNNPVCRIDTGGTDSVEAVDLDGNPVIDEDDIQGGVVSGQYQAPDGGGGVTNSYIVDGKIIDFGHGGRHVNNSNVNLPELEQAIAHDVVNRPPAYGNAKSVHDFVHDGRPLYYSYYTRDDSRINVGTYYFEEQLR